MNLEREAEKGEIDGLFPVPLYRANLNVDLKSIKTHLCKIAEQRKLLRNEILNVDTSHGVYTLTTDDFFAPLLNEFLTHSKIFLRNLGYDEDFLDQCYVDACWFNISYEDDNLAKHIHPGSLVSGGFYVETNPSDRIYFYREDDMILPPASSTDFSSKIAVYSCEEGQLLIFKSNLNHNTSVKREGRKIVISFNVNPMRQVPRPSA